MTLHQKSRPEVAVLFWKVWRFLSVSSAGTSTHEVEFRALGSRCHSNVKERASFKIADQDVKEPSEPTRRSTLHFVDEVIEAFSVQITLT